MKPQTKSNIRIAAATGLVPLATIFATAVGGLAGAFCAVSSPVVGGFSAAAGFVCLARGNMDDAKTCGKIFAASAACLAVTVAGLEMLGGGPYLNTCSVAGAVGGAGIGAVLSYKNLKDALTERKRLAL